MFNRKARSRNRKSSNHSPNRGFRRTAFETLESRQLLSVSLPTIAAQTVLAGAPLNLALSGADTTGNAIDYTVSVTNSSLTTASGGSAQLTPTVMPSTNPSIEMVVNDPTDGITNGTMIFQLFQNYTPNAVSEIEGLIEKSFYNNLTFHRIISDFMAQGGDPNPPTATNSGAAQGPGFSFDDEFNANLQFTSEGILALANSGPDTNGSQFFITASAQPSLDFRYTVFGFLTQGANVLNQILNVPVTTNSSGEDSQPVNTVTITSITEITDNQDGVLQLSAPNGATGTATVNVTATDSVTGDATSQSFAVTVGANTSVPPPFLDRPISPITTITNTPVTFTIPATDIDGNAINYAATVSPANSDLSLDVNSTTGQVTLTPSGGVSGVFSIQESVTTTSTSGTNTAADTQLVPVYISPAAPAVSFSGGAQTNLNNSTAGNELTFDLTGLVSGADVALFAGSTQIGSTTATGTSGSITTNGTASLADGAYQITATQTLEDQAVSVGNLSTTTNLASPASTPLSLTVDTAAPVLTAASPALGTAHLNTPITIPLAAFINNGTGTTAITDSYTGAVAGSIAVTATTGLGTWSYSLDGKTYDPIGTVSATSALLLPASAFLRYAPDGTDAESPTITYQAWDGITGTAGSTADTTASGTSAFSTASDTATLTVAAITDSTVLVAADPSLGTTAVSTPLTVALSGTFINNGSGTTTITATNTGAVAGDIAVTATTGDGVWSYSLDGTTFNAIGTVSDSAALLLPTTASLRYTPDGTDTETATITYRAWDGTTGAAGSTADTTTNGGTSSFSLFTDTASLTVNAVPGTQTSSTQGSPVVSGISPAQGPLAGGTTVTITGSGFTGATTVDFGSVPATNFTVDSDSEIVATSPAGTGVVDVTVITAEGTSATSTADQFTYGAASFTLSGPTSGTFTAGQTVTIQWTSADVPSGSTISLAYDTTSNFSDPTWIEIDAVDATSADSYSWNTAGVSAGTYYIDGYMYTPSTGAAVYSNLTSPITVTGPSFAITSPTSGTFTAGQAVTIQWSAAEVPSGSTVSLAYDTSSTWSNPTWIEIDAASAASDSYSWNTGNVSAGTYYVKGYMYTPSTSTAIFSFATSPITVSGPSFAITSPTSGTFAAGQTVTIQWNAAEVPSGSTVSLAYDTSSNWSDPTWIEIDAASASADSYSWNTADVSAGTYYVKGYMYTPSTSTALFSFATSPITVTGPSFAITVPTSRTLTPGQSVTVQWNAADVPSGSVISLAYNSSNNNWSTPTWIEIDTASATSDSYSWNTSGVAAGTYYLLGYMYTPSTGTALFSYITTPITVTSSEASTPAVTGISPAQGVATGGGSVTITGSGFTGATAVSFGGTAASSFTVNSDSQIVATSPAGTGTVDVTVTTAAGTSAASTADQFSYAPVVAGVSPATGAAAGGTSVTITGSGFTGATAVSFGGTAASSFTVNSDSQIVATSPAGTGTVDVTVTAPTGTSATSTADQFTYAAAAAVTGISPSQGPATGGTSVTITGSGFTGATAVSFDGTAASSFTVNSDSQIVATSPTGTGGVVDVTVTTPVGTSATSSADQFGYAAAVTGVSPTQGAATGGTSVTITGSGFTGATAVSFGGTSASSFTVNSDSQIVATSPAGTGGVVDVTVTTPVGTSATSAADQFSYAAAVTGISPTQGPAAGGTTVTITGAGFTGATAVSFGGTSASSFTVNSDSQIVATSPVGTGGMVDVTVTTPVGTSATSAADQFSYTPAVTGVSPTQGPATGGTTVMITGSGFTGATAVNFGGTSASSFTINSDSQIVATSPVGTGVADVTVTTPVGTSATSTADQFSYS